MARRGLLVTLLLALALTLCGLAASFPSGQYYPYAFMTTDAAAATARRYDYIIVGGGTAACPLAATLSTRFRVLVIERGGSPYGNPDIEELANFGKPLKQTDNYTTIAQSFVSEDGVTLARARVLGGATALNAGFYSRASAAYVSAMGWDKSLVAQSYAWVEARNAFRPSPLSPWSAAFRAALIQSGVLPDNGYTVEHVEGTKTSASTFDPQGRRHTAANFLAVANPRNIVVLLNATASRVLFGRGARAVGVEFLHNGVGSAFRAFLDGASGRSEVIVSAGSLGSPQLLLLSGVGPREELARMGIPVVADVRGVGDGVQDSPATGLSLLSPPGGNLTISSIQAVGILPGSQSYLESSSTPESGSVFQKMAFPMSRGVLRLRTKDPRDNPSVRYNYFQHPLDVSTCVSGVRAVLRVFNTSVLRSEFSFRGSVSGGRGAGGLRFATKLPPTDDAGIAAYCKAAMFTMWHFHGGCHVDQCVDRRYRVLGTSALRVVDGSTFKDCPGTNPQATTMMLGRYMGIQILRERGISGY